MSTRDSKYFSSQKKGAQLSVVPFLLLHLQYDIGEIAEWRHDLKCGDREVMKIAIKRGESPFFLVQSHQLKRIYIVIAAMTVGKDVCTLFADVVNCMQTNDVELKKLVYLYVINYARSNPDLAILAVNTFVKVSLA